MMIVERTQLERVLLVKPSVFSDHRGEYVEIYNEDLYRKNGIDVAFVQDDISMSYKNVLRGIHGDDATWKLISCLYGEFYLVVLNYDQGSKDFGKWQSFVLSDKNRQQVIVPPGFGNGHFVLSERAIFHYKQSTYYDPGKQFTVKWNDPRFNISWPVKDPILSKRDELGRRE
ncbi:MAG: dTDP-4-dehydrorhamnose 3,5-epimerase [Candidatus Omnitrophica bacterium]|nr:dTDP-4-dehydrorhamnose 3,5-epimerase [Candidatus Omnitrophota bacterium]